MTPAAVCRKHGSRESPGAAPSSSKSQWEQSRPLLSLSLQLYPGVCSPGHHAAAQPTAAWGGCTNQAMPPTQVPPRHSKTESGREDTDTANIILVVPCATIHHGPALTCLPGKVTQGQCMSLVYVKIILVAGAIRAGGVSAHACGAGMGIGMRLKQSQLFQQQDRHH